MDNKRLIKKTGLYLIGNLSSKIISFLLIPLYAFYLPSADLGNYDFSQTIILILVPVVFIAIWESILKFLLTYEDEREKIITTSLVFVLSIMIIIISVAVISSFVLSIHVEGFEFIIIMAVAYSFAYIWQYYARGLKQNKTYILASIYGTIINFVVNLILLCVFRVGINSLYISYISGQVTIFIILECKLHCLKMINKENFDSKILKSMLIFSAPLVLNLISMWFISGFGRVIVNKILGADMAGLYAFANKFGVIVSVLGSVVSMALIEESVLKAKEEGLDEYFSLIIQKLFQIFQSIILLASPFIIIFYHFIKKTEYVKSISIFPYFLLFSMFMTMSTNVGAVFQAIEKTKYIFISTIIGALFTFSFSIILISKIGIQGVAIGQLVGAFSILISRFLLARKFINLKVKCNNISFMLLLYIITTILAIKLDFMIAVLITLINLGIVIYVNRNDLHKIFEIGIAKLTSR